MASAAAAGAPAAPAGAAPRPAFCIVDPSLRDFVGHHFAYDHAVAAAAAAAGYEAVALGHRAAIPAVAAALRVAPCFRRDIWGKHPLARRLPGPAGRALDHALCAADFARDLRRGLAGVPLPPGSVLLAHMVTAKHLPGLATALADLPRGGRDVAAVLLLRYQPFFYDNALAARAFRRLEALAAAGRRIRLASDSARLAARIGRLTALPVEVLPIPHTPPEAAAVEPLRPRPAVRFASLGNARDEKGCLEILEAIRRLRAEPEGLAGLEFVLQANDAAPDVRAALDAFAADDAPPEATLLPEALDAAAYEAALLAADVVLVPYWRSIYDARTSGVFLEALAAGKPVVATRDTWMSDELEAHGGAGILVPDRDPAALAAAIRRAARELPALAARARAARPGVRARHSAAALVRQCAEGPPPAAVAAEQARPRPPRIAMFYPWDDLLERRAGTSLNLNLRLDVLAPLVGSVQVLQGGHAPPARPAENVEVAPARRRRRQELARRAFRLLALPLVGRAGFGQELALWYHLEPRLDPGFRRRVRDMVLAADAVLLEYSFWGGPVLRACRDFGVPCVLTQHDVLSQQVVAPRSLRRLTLAAELAALRRADRVLCVSEADAATFRGHGVEARSVPIPADLDRAGAPAPEPAEARRLLAELYGITPAEGPVALFVGSAHPPNLAAVARLREVAAACPAAAFVVAGACAPPGRAGNLLATGRVDDAALELLYALADLALVPLDSGSGASLKTVEAMARGKPVLGTAVGFRGLQVRPGEDCVLEDDLARWPGLIERLAADPALAARLGAAARRAAEERHGHRRVMAAYTEALGLPPPDPPAPPGPAGWRLPLALAERALAAGRPETAAGLLADAIEAAGPDAGARERAVARGVAQAALAAGHADIAARALRRLPPAAPRPPARPGRAEAEVLALVRHAVALDRPDVARALLQHHLPPPPGGDAPDGAVAIPVRHGGGVGPGLGRAQAVALAQEALAADCVEFARDLLAGLPGADAAPHAPGGDAEAGAEPPRRRAVVG